LLALPLNTKSRAANGLAFPAAAGDTPNTLETRLSPGQMLRWVHFPCNAELKGEFIYRVNPVFINVKDELSYGEPSRASIELRGVTSAKRSCSNRR